MAVKRSARSLLGIVLSVAMLSLAAVWLLYEGSPTGLSGEIDADTYVESDIPALDTMAAFQEFAGARHNRLVAYASTNPDQVVSAYVTPRYGLNTEEIAQVANGHEVLIYYVEYNAGASSGAASLTNSITLEGVERQARTTGVLPLDQRLEVHYFKAKGPAESVAGLTRDERLALVYADHSLDRLEGLRPLDFVGEQPRSVFDDYQRLTAEVPLVDPSDAAATPTITPAVPIP